MDAILNVALPMFALMACGFFAGKIGVMGEESTAALNTFVWWFALPALFVLSLSRVPIQQFINVPFLIVFGGAAMGTFLISMVLARLATGARLAELSVHGIFAAFGNLGYMGIPLCISAFGPEGALPATLASVFGATIMLGLSVVLIETDLHSGSGVLASFGKVLRAIIRNPLLISSALGIFVSLMQWQLPAPLVGFLELLSKAAVPCALFAIGLFLVGKSLSTGAGEVGLAVIVKKVLQPALAWALALIFLDMNSMWAKAAIILAALPTATNVFILARNYNLFMNRASGTILVSTLLSVPILSALLVVLKIG